MRTSAKKLISTEELSNSELASQLEELGFNYESARNFMEHTDRNVDCVIECERTPSEPEDESLQAFWDYIEA